MFDSTVSNHQAVHFKFVHENGGQICIEVTVKWGDAAAPSHQPHRDDTGLPFCTYYHCITSLLPPLLSFGIEDMICNRPSQTSRSSSRTMTR